MLPVSRWHFVVLVFTLTLVMKHSALAQRVKNADLAPANVDAPEAPTIVGNVVAYEPDKSIALESRNRSGVIKSEFAIVKDKTKIELPPRIKEIKVGLTLAVWADKDDPKVAAKIATQNNAAPAGMRRPNNRPATGNAPAGRSGNARPSSIAPATITPVSPAKRREPGLSPAEVAASIDRFIASRLAGESVPASPRCDDAEFIRRVYLDITGIIPPPEKVAAFLDRQDPEKRALLIDELLASPNYGLHFGHLWSERIVPHDLPTNAAPFIQWLADRFNQGAGWNDIVSDLVTAEGSFTPIRLRAPGAAHNPPATFILANSEDNQPRPDRLAGAAAALFLGVQIQCAECHDHPFAKWRQTDFWGVAAFFGQLHTERTDQPPALVWQETPLAPGQPAEVVIPTTALRAVGTTVPARFLEDEASRPDDQPLLRHALARWMTAPDNRLFAKATVNRLWAHFFGRGLVNPVDDMHVENAPSHPAILALLADELTKSGYDLKYVIRCITLSQTYQRTSRPLPENEPDREAYSRGAVKVLSPGVLYDCLTLTTGLRELSLGLPRSKSKQGVTTQLFPRDAFIDFFRTQDDAADPTDYSHGIPQVLKLLNAAQLNHSAPVAVRLAQSGLGREAVIEQLYLAALARRPTAEEVTLMVDFLSRQEASLQQGYSAILWVLVNSSEFVLNH